MSRTATNWSESEDTFTQAFYDQQQNQFWLSEEIPLANDALAWKNLTDAERLCYTRASAGLNAMDTLQGEVGMPSLHQLVEGHQRKATLALFAMMENIHARSYSMANKTFLPASDEAAVFDWIEHQPQLQYKVNMLSAIYEGSACPAHVMAASCLLETALFYSGFFYPMYLAGQGKMVNMGEIFNLIIKDESLHGTYVGLLFQEEFAALGSAEQGRLKAWFQSLAQELYENECAYTDVVYGELGLTGEVKAFVRYNFNVCCDNLGLERLFPEEEVNAVVLNGINARNTTHDFFSAKGNSYTKITVEPITDADFKEVWDV